MPATAGRGPDLNLQSKRAQRCALSVDAGAWLSGAKPTRPVRFRHRLQIASRSSRYSIAARSAFFSALSKSCRSSTSLACITRGWPSILTVIERSSSLSRSKSEVPCFFGRPPGFPVWPFLNRERFEAGDSRPDRRRCRRSCRRPPSLGRRGIGRRLQRPGVGNRVEIGAIRTQPGREPAHLLQAPVGSLL